MNVNPRDGSQRRRIFVSLPNNQRAGGNKVGNQLVKLFRDRGFEAYVVLPREPCPADWLMNPAPVINLSQYRELCGPEDILM